MKYLPDFRLPDKALDLADQACAAVRFRTLTPRAAGENSETRIGRQEIAAVVAARCGIPVGTLTADEGERLKRLEELLSGRVKGQPEAIAAVADAVRLARAGLKEPERPAGVFLFVGPSGTGKTELAKALAEFLFHDERRMIRFDMSEFMEEHSVAKLIGSPPGYVGHNEGGQLTDAIRTHPYSLVLFDEIEKSKVDAIRSKLFGALRVYYQERDSLRVLVNFRKTFIERLLAEGEEAAEATTGDYQREAAEKEREYESTAAALEGKRELGEEERERIAADFPEVRDAMEASWSGERNRDLEITPATAVEAWDSSPCRSRFLNRGSFP